MGTNQIWIKRLAALAVYERRKSFLDSTLPTLRVDLQRAISLLESISFDSQRELCRRALTESVLSSCFCSMREPRPLVGIRQALLYRILDQLSLTGSTVEQVFAGELISGPWLSFGTREQTCFSVSIPSISHSPLSLFIRQHADLRKFPYLLRSIGDSAPSLIDSMYVVSPPSQTIEPFFLCLCDPLWERKMEIVESMHCTVDLKLTEWRVGANRRGILFPPIGPPLSFQFQVSNSTMEVSIVKESADPMSEDVCVSLHLGSIRLPLERLLTLKPGDRLAIELPAQVAATLEFGGQSLATLSVEKSGENLSLIVR